MRIVSLIALSIVAVASAGCSLLGKSGDAPDATPAVTSAPPAPVIDEPDCKASLQQCIDTVAFTVRAFPSLNETRKLCPLLADKAEIKIPVTSDDLAKVKAMANSTDCRSDIAFCRSIRGKVGKALTDGMKSLNGCDKK